MSDSSTASTGSQIPSVQGDKNTPSHTAHCKHCDQPESSTNKLFNVYSRGQAHQLLSGCCAKEVQGNTYEYLKAFYPRTKWQLQNVTVVGVAA